MKAEKVKFQKSQNPAIKISFKFSWDLVEKVKSLPGRKFHPDGKYWTCPVSIEAVEKLKEWNFQMDEGLELFLQKSKVHVDEVSKISIPTLKGTLFPFQEKGVSFVEKKDGRALIADEMGLGKTIQALAWLELHPEKKPVVIICPSHLKLNWLKEIKAWMSDPSAEVLSGGTPYPISKNIVIINYDILDKWVNSLKSINPQVLITDECHYFKNNQAKRTKAVKKLGKNIPHIIALSGTPIVNRPIEIFNALKLVDDTVMPNMWSFAHRYCNAKHNGFGWDFNGASNIEELHEKLTNSIMIRRLKKDVLKDLPDKIYNHIPIELTNREEYKTAEKDFVEFIRQKKGDVKAEKASRAQQFAEIEGLKQLAVKGKLKQSIEWIRDFLESDKKLVVFGTHKFVVEELMKEFPNAVKVDGSITGQKRHEAVESFQNNPEVRLFFGNIQAAGTGLTLTAASDVVFLELPWTPGELNQAEDRCHRISQKNSVTIHYLLASETIEEQIAKLIDSKRKVMDGVLDGKETGQESLLSELMNKYV